MSSGKKKGGLAAFAKKKTAAAAVTEAELLVKPAITVEDVMRLREPCAGYLCKPTDNTFGVEFTAFKLRDAGSGATLFEVAKPDDAPADVPDDSDDSGRFVQYQFPPAFLQLRQVGATKAHAEREWNHMSPVLIGPAAASSVATIGSAQKSMLVAAHAHFCVPCDYMNAASFITKASCSTGVTFQVGDAPVTNLKMVERHFYKDRLLKSFDFDFGFCIPGSKNTIEHIYEFPTLTEAECKDMIASPFETKSDSFYFVDGKLIMHNRAEYAYDAE
eukprot:gene3695-10458_t